MFLTYIPLPTFRVMNVMNVMNVINMRSILKILEILEPKPLEKPLGRWCLCGNKNSIDALEWKELQKHKRQKLLENKQDPFEIYSKTSI